MGTARSTTADTTPQQQSLTLRESEWVVILFNDDYTPFEWVITLLMTVFDRDADSAVRVTKSVHNTGRGIGGVYSKERAIRLADEANRRARDAGHPFKCAAQPLSGIDAGHG